MFALGPNRKGTIENEQKKQKQIDSCAQVVFPTFAMIETVIHICLCPFILDKTFPTRNAHFAHFYVLLADNDRN